MNHHPWLRRRARIAVRAWLMPACVLLVLAGLFGMHGLSDHGMSTADAQTMRGQVAAPVAAVAHPVEQVVSASPAGSARVAHHAMGHRGGTGQMGGLCLAILTGLLLGLAGWLSAQRRHPLFEKQFRVAPLPRPRGRDPDPPSLVLLSVSRC